MGEMVLTCLGGTPTPAGQPIALSNFRVALGAPITSRVVNPLTAASEALLIVDEPFPSNPFPTGASRVPGSPTGQNLCLASGGTQCQILGVAPGAFGISEPYQGQYNVFQGISTVEGGVSYVDFIGVPIDPPGNNAQRIIRITNIRGDMTKSTGLPLFGTVTVSGDRQFTPQVASTQVATPFSGLAGGGCANTDSVVHVCASESFASVFATAAITTNDASGGALRQTRSMVGGAIMTQNVPGLDYFTESGFTGVGNPPDYTGGGIGEAAHGTWLAITVANVPAGLTITAPGSVTHGALILYRVDASQGWQFHSSFYASAPADKVVLDTTVSNPPASTTVVYEVVADDPTTLESFDIPFTANSQSSVSVSGVQSSVALTPPGNNPYVSPALQFVPITPCRAVDTRNPAGPLGGPSITGGSSRDFVIAGNACGIPANARAYSLNAAIVPTSHGYMTLWPTGQPQPGTASVNSRDGGVHSNGAIVPAGAQGAISAYAFDTMDVVLDINGYFVPAADNNPSALAFYPLTPCRVVDTRNADGDLGGPFMSGGNSRVFPMLTSVSCPIPSSAQAYSLNLAVIPHGAFHYLTAWPDGQSQPQVASLNDPQSVNHSNGAIVPAGANGSIDVYVTNDADVVLDINGYFAPPGTGGLSLYTLQPCRALDTRNPAGSPPFTGTLAVDVVDSGCGAPPAAQAYIFNATVVPQNSHGYLTLWQQNTPQPATANLNDPNGITTGNMAIVPTNNGSINAFFFGTTYLVLDLFGYFAP